jgi:polysaccharide deacetylase 2 family uncharacterized protein YibQ
MLQALPLLAGQRIALIMDDMGYSQRRGMEALQLDGDITFSFLPHAPYTRRLAGEAHLRKKEIMVHLPMQSINANELDQGALEMDMTRRGFYRTLLNNLDAVPHAVGANNHMGSLLTRHPGAMHWLMLGLKNYGDLFFVDSVTSDDSIARQIAAEDGVLSLSRDVFLDHNRNAKAIGRQFDRLIATAKRRGSAIGIGHPYPETLSVLRQKLANLPNSAVSLVKASELVKEYSENHPRWHVSSSPSPRVAKNSKQSP